MAWKKLIRYFALPLLISGWAWAAQGQSQLQDHGSDYYKAPSYKLGKVAKIIITIPSQHLGNDSKEKCETFVITPKLSLFFFKHAKLVSGESNFHDADYSSCKAEGNVTFTNGDKGDWTISRYGSGLLQMKAGKLKGKLLYMHCSQCEDWGI